MTLTEMLLLLASGAAGAALARLVRLPMWPLTGSLVGAAAMHLVVGGAVTAPTWWNLAGQLLVGTAVGATIAPGVVRQFRAVLLPGTLAVVAIVGVGVGCGLVVAATGVVDPTVAVFGMVPGGVGEMVAAATALNAESAVVAGMHVIRLLVVLSVLPLLVRWARRWERRDPDEGPR